MNCLVVDIETTGLDPEKHQILEIYMGLFDPFKSPKIIRDTYFILNHKDQTLSWDAFVINKDLIMKSFNEVGYSPEAVRGLLLGFLCNLPVPITLCGKNVSGFDKPFLEKFLGMKLDKHDLGICHRSLDPAILYINKNDDVPPSLKECMIRAKLPFDESKQHDARYDSECIAMLLYEYFNNFTNHSLSDRFIRQTI